MIQAIVYVSKNNMSKILKVLLYPTLSTEWETH